jgi:5'(3')-deoxyribonucleotidase
MVEFALECSRWCVLYDVVEDIEASWREIGGKFGEEVYIVGVMSFDASVTDKTEWYQETFQRCVRVEIEIVLIQTFGILENGDYCVLANDEQAFNFLIEKMKCLWKFLMKLYGKGGLGIIVEKV